MNKISISLAYRFLKARSYEKNISTMFLISSLTILVSTCALALVAAIMQGFEEKTTAMLKGLNPDLIVRIPTGLDAQTITRSVEQHFPTQLSGVTQLSYGYGMIEHPETGEKNIIKIIAVDPTTLDSVIPLSSYLSDRTHTLRTLLAKRSLIMGMSTARHMGISAGDQCSLLYIPEEVSGSRVTFDRIKLTVADTLSTGLEEYDRDTILIHKDLFEELFPDQSETTLGISVTHPDSRNDIRTFLHQEWNIRALTWEQLYAPLLSALKLEKYVAVMVIGLLCIVATSVIIALMFMIITAKKRDCALLKAMGLPAKDIRTIFISMGLMITSASTVCGLALAAFCSWLLERYHLISIPDVYYVSYVPAHFTLPLALAIFCASILIACITTLLPLSSLKLDTVMSMLKFE